MSARLWIKLQLAAGAGSTVPKKLIGEFGSVDGIFAATESELERAIPHNRAARIADGDFDEADRILKQCRNAGIDIICYDDPRYPRRLKNIDDPPALLYCKGELPQIDDEVAIAVVGPRHPDEYGIKAGFSLSARLSLAGVLIVSGGATGVDSEAHKGALWAKGKTVAVLGCGHLSGYLPSNAALRESICLNGAVISEYPPYQRVFRSSFPVRNRIMSGLSVGTAVIEAGAKSGALITARLAAEQGRDVFVVPGQPGNELFEGSNLMLRDGAKPLLSALDVLEEYTDRFPHKLDLKKAFENADKSIAAGFRAARDSETVARIKQNGAAEIPVVSAPEAKPTVSAADIGCSDKAKKIFSALSGGGMCADELTVVTGLDITSVIAALTELEILGAVGAAAGGIYKIV